MRGRKPKPTAVKILEGNPGKRALNSKEPKPPTALPSCPSHIKGEARKEWRHVVRDLHEQGILTKIDRAILASYCIAWGHWVDAEKHLETEKAVIETDKGNLVQNPYIQISKRSMDQVVKFATELGMTPSSRSRIHVDKPNEEDELERILFGKDVSVSK
jgi:P27 family predicted phage terminase small subunit